MSPLSAPGNSSGDPFPRGDRKVTLGIVDDHPVVRLGINALLSTQDDFEVAGLAESGEAALALVRNRQIDILLLDLRMPGLSGVETLKRLGQVDGGVRIIVVSSFEYDEEIYAAVNAGAKGFVHKEADSEEILHAIRTVARGQQAFPKHIAERLASHQMTAGLSDREREVLQLVATGLTNKEVAQTLSISQFTVRNHLKHIAEKLEITDRTEAVFVALQTGLISPP